MTFTAQFQPSPQTGSTSTAFFGFHWPTCIQASPSPGPAVWAWAPWSWAQITSFFLLHAALHDSLSVPGPTQGSWFPLLVSWRPQELNSNAEWAPKSWEKWLPQNPVPTQETVRKCGKKNIHGKSGNFKSAKRVSSVTYCCSQSPHDEVSLVAASGAWSAPDCPPQEAGSLNNGPALLLAQPVPCSSVPPPALPPWLSLPSASSAS